ncbi:11775_t:CDS:2 [Entrophospora sp. SA101]|nr:11775_t:CDS:2 [Entrophospora sp. SA101]
MVAGELVMEDVYIIVLIQPTEIDEQQDETFIPKFSITDTIWNLLNFLVYPLSGFDVCEDELKCIRALGKKLLRLIFFNIKITFCSLAAPPPLPGGRPRATSADNRISLPNRSTPIAPQLPARTPTTRTPLPVPPPLPPTSKKPAPILPNKPVNHSCKCILIILIANHISSLDDYLKSFKF